MNKESLPTDTGFVIACSRTYMGRRYSACVLLILPHQIHFMAKKGGFLIIYSLVI